MSRACLFTTFTLSQQNLCADNGIKNRIKSHKIPGGAMKHPCFSLTDLCKVHSQFTDFDSHTSNLRHLIRDKKFEFKQMMHMFCCVFSWKKTGNNFILYNKCDHYQWLQFKPLHLTCHINSYCMYTDDPGALSLTFCHPSHPLGHHHPCTTSSPLSFHFQQQWQFECSFVVAAAFDDQSINTFLLPTVH